MPTVALPEATPFTHQATVWLLLPVTVAANWVVAPPRRVTLGGLIVIPLEVDSDFAPPTVPPPQPDHTRTTKERRMAPANLAPEDLTVPIISDPLS